jgi:hypothetical protein
MIKLKKIFMKPKIIKLFNQKEENYFKFTVDKNSFEAEDSTIQFLKELGFKRPFYPKFSNKSEDEEFSKQRYKNRVGLYKFLENKSFKIHIIFSEDGINMIVRCNQANRKILNKSLEKFFTMNFN